jgi:hypothetical protein
MARVFAALAGCVLLLIWTGCDNWPGVNGSKDGGVSGGGSTRIEDTSGQIGSACSNGLATCSTGLTCIDTFPNGMCTRTCQSNSDCATGVCLSTAKGTLCMKSCLGDQTCRPSYSCISDGTTSACQPGSSQSSSILDAGLD